MTVRKLANHQTVLSQPYLRPQIVFASLLPAVLVASHGMTSAVPSSVSLTTAVPALDVLTTAVQASADVPTTFCLWFSGGLVSR